MISGFFCWGQYKVDRKLICYMYHDYTNVPVNILSSLQLLVYYCIISKTSTVPKINSLLKRFQKNVSHQPGTVFLSRLWDVLYLTDGRIDSAKCILMPLFRPYSFNRQRFDCRAYRYINGNDGHLISEFHQVFH